MKENKKSFNFKTFASTHLTKQTLIDYLIISLGTFLLAYAAIAFWAPKNLVTGGVSGLAIIIHGYSEDIVGFAIPIWLSTWTLNTPLLILGYKIIPRAYFIRTVYASQFLTFALFLANFLPAPDSDLLLSGVFGGVIGGVGVGLVYRTMATTGGTTLAAELLKRKFFKHLPVANVLFAVDTTIVMVGFFAFGPINTMYAVIAIFVCSKVTNTVIEGMNFSKATFIISKKSEAISQSILKNLNRGCTALDSHGMFTKQPQSMLMCVVNAKEIVALKQLVYSLDEKAFVVVADVREVMGEGFSKGKDSI